MKKYYLLIIIISLYFTQTGWSQCNGFNSGKDKYCIANIKVVYTENKFEISGFEINDSFRQDGINSPELALFIETGDGNFISEVLKPVPGETITLFYDYPSVGFTYHFTASITKNYDGGGPRRMILWNQPAIQTNPVDSGKRIAIKGPIPGARFFAFPRDIVQDDTIMLVISAESYNFEKGHLFFCYNSKFFKEVIVSPNFVNHKNYIMEANYIGKEFSILTYPNGAEKNTFLMIIPDKNAISKMGVGGETEITIASKLIQSSSSKLWKASPDSIWARLDFNVLSSHDPNNIAVRFCEPCAQGRCPPKSKREMRHSPLKLTYTVNFENCGAADEDSVQVMYCFRMNNLKDSGSFYRAELGGKLYERTGDLQLAPPTRHLVVTADTGKTGFLLEGTLSGINNLPYGSPATKGSIDFIIETRKMFKDLSSKDSIIAGAEITFVSAGETIKTNVVNFTRKEYRKSYNRKCICQQRFFLWRWICRLFKGI
jgi:hypothetical protein